MNTPNPTPPDREPVALYLRDNGSLMLVRGAHVVEMQLTVPQLLQLGTDALRVAVALEPACLQAAMQAMAQTEVLVPVNEQPEATPCRLN